MKAPVFNGLLMAVAVALAHGQIRELPAYPVSPPAEDSLRYHSVELENVSGPLRLAGAWELSAADPRFGGISAMAIDRGRFLVAGDRGSVARFDPPAVRDRKAWVADLHEGPGPWGRKWARDAESLVADPRGRGWWVGYEQHHSLWLYTPDFGRVLDQVDLDRPDWWDNRGAEGLLTDRYSLVVIGENGRDVLRVSAGQIERIALAAGADVAEAATAPDGSQWLLLRSKGLGGISQAIAPLVRTPGGYRAGRSMAVPKAALDNYEGMAITPLPGGGWRFWLITDNGHRILARTLLVALDYAPAPGTAKARRQAPGP